MTYHGDLPRGTAKMAVASRLNAEGRRLRDGALGGYWSPEEVLPLLRGLLADAERVVGGMPDGEDKMLAGSSLIGLRRSIGAVESRQRPLVLGLGAARRQSTRGAC